MDHVEIYVFNSNGNRETVDYEYVKIEGWSSSKSYVLPVTQGEKIFLVVTSSNLGALSGQDLESVRNLMNSYQLDNTNSRIIPTEGIPMAGESKPVNVGIDEHGVPVTIEIDRAFSKLKPLQTIDNVEVDIDNEGLIEIFGQVVTGNLKFDLLEYYVVNGMTKSYTFSKYNTTNEQQAWVGWNLNDDLSNYYKSAYTNKEPVTVYSGAVSGNVWIKTEDKQDIFVHENSPKEVTSSTGLAGYERRSVCAMILKGKLTHPTEGERTRYWRLNIASDYAYKLFRNVEYTITLESVSTKGYGTPEEAEEDEDEGEVIPKEGASVSANISIKAWRNMQLGQGV
ncbi:MAG: hypothetical protein LIP01_08415 [Tannerellaceae bacterium]|nr:hypothetical protein [Tannerellaceae bacterium]